MPFHIEGRRRSTAIAVFFCAMLLSGIALGQTVTGFQVEQFEPLPAQQTSTLNIMRSDVLGHMVPSAGLFLHFAKSPIVLYERDGDERKVASRIIDDQLKAEVMLSVGWLDQFDIGLVMPVSLYQAGTGDQLIGGSSQLDTLSFADARIIPRAVLLDPDDMAGFGLAIGIPIYIPIGGDYQSDGSLRVEPRLAGDFRRNRLLAAVNVAYQLRPEAIAHNYVSDDALRWGLALEHGVGPKYLAVMGSVFGSYTLADGRNPNSLSDVTSNAAARPVEALLGVKVSLANDITMQVGAGSGLTDSVGAPQFRIFTSVGWSPIDRDLDADGIFDSDDDCPGEPEDVDEYQDSDGCPDVDDDNDGVLDVDDDCRLEPEDADGFEDEDGCPDPDNDQDGVLDNDDACMNTPGIAKHMGCPDTDGDGLQDKDDECPEDPEDFDTFEDENGCPDPDNDKDGILDAVDKCPMEPEIINGVMDEDGCPDKGETKVRVTAAKIEILDKVYFATNKATIKKRSFDVLNQVASVMKNDAKIKKVRVEGHTDSRGKDDYNKNLSQRRADAVVVYLSERGIDAERLTAIGYGEERPIEANTKKKGRAANRRVEFTILE
jgi:outer membrane protein OmpA-like peptidoglycan-associated protein